MTDDIQKTASKYWRKLSILAGLFLIFDGIISIIVFRDQKLLNQVPRIIRAIIGLVIMVAEKRR
jgi:intracellular septation protein A